MGRQDSKAEDSDRHHRDLFRRYEWEAMDEFDAVLLDGVDRGLFDEVAIKRQADELQKKLQLTDKNNSFEQAWNLFNGSFNIDQDTVLNALIESVKTNFEVITPINLNETIAFLKEFGRETRPKRRFNSTSITVKRSLNFGTCQLIHFENTSLTQTS